MEGHNNENMTANSTVTGPAVWLQLAQQEQRGNAGTDNAGSSNHNLQQGDLSDTYSDEEIPPLEIETVQNNDTHQTAPIHEDDEDPVLSSPDPGSENGWALRTRPVYTDEHSFLPMPQTWSDEDGDFEGLQFPPSEIIRAGFDANNATDEIYQCRNHCDPEVVTPLDVLVELGCLCRGGMSRMCIMCLLKWFGPRIMLEQDSTCEVCQTRLDESVKRTVMSAMADHTGGRAILVDALGPPLIRAHIAGRGLGRMDPAVLVQENDQHVNEPPNAAPNRGAQVAHFPARADTPAITPPFTPPASPSTAAAPSPQAPSLPVTAPGARRRRSFWTKMRRYLGCATAPQVQ